ncbi:MAG: hypothetical protein Q7R56_02005 [Nanoarchaeota archaeon]|nr:hypothetical protein [Nanoarchaeota archaeon]
MSKTNTVSADLVQRVKDIITEEDLRLPLSDKDVCTILAKKPYLTRTSPQSVAEVRRQIGLPDPEKRQENYLASQRIKNTYSQPYSTPSTHAKR